MALLSFLAPITHETAYLGRITSILCTRAYLGGTRPNVSSVDKPGNTPGNVNFLLPPRQSRGISHRISQESPVTLRQMAAELAETHDLRPKSGPKRCWVT